MENPIKLFIHCKDCIEEMPRGISPGDFQNLAAGIDDSGENIAIWCNRHEKIVTRIKLDQLK